MTNIQLKIFLMIIRFILENIKDEEDMKKAILLMELLISIIQ